MAITNRGVTRQLRATLLAGGIDEFFSRTDATGAFSPLTDALGSTVALTDSTGALQTQYTYEPFGNTTISGPGNANPYQYTGRENDGTGLYYYRARYYSPIYQRFISEDPLRFAGGINFYAYAGNDPVDFRDPFGLKPPNGAGSGVPGNAPGSPNSPPGAPNPWGSPGSPNPPGSCQSFYCSPTFWTTAVTLGLALAAPEVLPLELAAEAAEGAEAAEAAAQTSVFWSGGQEAEAAATEWAYANNGVTLGMTQAGQGLATATQNMSWAEAQPLWNTLSQQFAADASGDVQAFVGPNATSDSIFFQTELPTLLSNPSVTTITINF